MIVSATRYLPADADVAAVDEDLLQVLCPIVGGESVVMSKIADRTSYTVGRSAR